jgi:hypothetical protein
MAQREYKAYLLRMWRENQHTAWRALLENPNNGERAAFATLRELVTYLEAKTGEAIPVSPPDDRPQTHKNLPKESFNDF